LVAAREFLIKFVDAPMKRPHKAPSFDPNSSQYPTVTNRTRKTLAPVLAASILLYSPAAFALTGGPFDNGYSPSATAGGTYAGVITGKNLTAWFSSASRTPASRPAALPFSTRES
jgi:hypothetical protein